MILTAFRVYRIFLMLGHDLFGRGGPETTRVDIFSEKKNIYMISICCLGCPQPLPVTRCQEADLRLSLHAPRPPPHGPPPRPLFPTPTRCCRRWSWSYNPCLGVPGYPENGVPDLIFFVGALRVLKSP